MLSYRLIGSSPIEERSLGIALSMPGKDSERPYFHWSNTLPIWTNEDGWNLTEYLGIGYLQTYGRRPGEMSLAAECGLNLLLM